MISERLLKILACPRCVERPALRQEGDNLVCTKCGWSFRIVEGVPHLLPEDGTPPASEPEGN